jgi:hypothetical protein
MRCIWTVPVLLPASVTRTIDLPVVALMNDNPVAEDPLLEWVAAPALHSPEFALFLKHHQFLI